MTDVDFLWRPVTSDELVELGRVLVGTRDSAAIGLSQIGINPETFDDSDIANLVLRLAGIGCLYSRKRKRWAREAVYA